MGQDEASKTAAVINAGRCGESCAGIDPAKFSPALLALAIAAHLAHILSNAGSQIDTGTHPIN